MEEADRTRSKVGKPVVEPKQPRREKLPTLLGLGMTVADGVADDDEVELVSVPVAVAVSIVVDSSVVMGGTSELLVVSMVETMSEVVMGTSVVTVVSEPVEVVRLLMVVWPVEVVWMVVTDVEPERVVEKDEVVSDELRVVEVVVVLGNKGEELCPITNWPMRATRAVRRMTKRVTKASKRMTRPRVVNE